MPSLQSLWYGIGGALLLLVAAAVADAAIVVISSATTGKQDDQDDNPEAGVVPATISKHVCSTSYFVFTLSYAEVGFWFRMRTEIFLHRDFRYGKIEKTC